MYECTDGRNNFVKPHTFFTCYAAAVDFECLKTLDVSIKVTDLMTK